MDSQFIVGIDLGTTNSALAYCESAASERAHIEIDTIPQLVNPNEIADRTLLPSFLYIPGDSDFPKGSLRLPWDAEPKFVIGELARVLLGAHSNTHDPVDHNPASSQCLSTRL